jgi:single-strand DNA-binding protein
MSNNISFLGRIGKDPELKTVGNTDLLELNVANNVGFKRDDQTTNWFRCSVWGKRGVSLHPHLSKGKQVFITGQLTLREYTNKEGQKGVSAEVRVDQLEFVSGGGDGSNSGSSYAPPVASQSRPSSSDVASTPETDDDMPF